MAKKFADSVLDAALDKIATSTLLHICTAEPANLAGVAAVSLGSVAMTSGNFTKAGGSPGGRTSTVASKTVTATGSGTVTHVVLVTGSELLVASTTASTAVTSGNTVTTDAWTINLGDPA